MAVRSAAREAEARAPPETAARANLFIDVAIAIVVPHIAKLDRTRMDCGIQIIAIARLRRVPGNVAAAKLGGAHLGSVVTVAVLIRPHSDRGRSFVNLRITVVVLPVAKLGCTGVDCLVVLVTIAVADRKASRSGVARATEQCSEAFGSVSVSVEIEVESARGTAKNPLEIAVARRIAQR